MSTTVLFPQESPSPLRIGTGSMVLAAHLVVLLAMSLAVPEQEPRPQRVVPAAIQVDIVPTPPAVATPPPPPMPSAPTRPVIQPQPQPRPLPLQEEPVFALEPVAAPSETVVPDLAPSGFGDAAATLEPGGQAGLALLQAPPPPYPARARRMGWQGEVLLRIHIGADGWPREVTVLRGSGHAELDRAARRHVAENWRFAAPLHRGHAVEAWGEVPIRFSLY